MGFSISSLHQRLLAKTHKERDEYIFGTYCTLSTTNNNPQLSSPLPLNRRQE